MRHAKAHLTEFATRSADNGDKYISGYFSVFDDVYQITEDISESIGRHRFDETIGDDIRALTNHDTTLVLGRTKAGTLKLHVDDKGLYGEIKINEDDVDAMNLYARVQRGDVSQCSFGFEIEEEHYREDGKRTHFEIDRLKLYEVSCVTFPAYERTEIQARQRDIKAIRDRHHDVWKEEAKKRIGGNADAEGITDA